MLLRKPLKLVTSTIILAASLFSESAQADVRVSPLTVDLRPVTGSSSTPFSIDISANDDSHLEVSIQKVEQDELGNLHFVDVDAGSVEARLVKLEKGSEAKVLKKGESWKLTGEYYFSRLDRRQTANLVVMIRDRNFKGEEKAKTAKAFSPTQHFRYAVTLKVSSSAAQARMNASVSFAGVERHRNEIRVKAKVRSRSVAMMDLRGEAIVREAKTNKLVERVPMTFESLLTKTGTRGDSFRLHPENEVIIVGRLKKAAARGDYKISMSLAGKKERFSASSSAKPLKIGDDLLGDLPIQKTGKYLMIELNNANKENKASVHLINPNFYPVSVTADLPSYEGEAKMTMDPSSAEIPPGGELNFVVALSGYKARPELAKDPGLGELRFLIKKSDGKAVETIEVPIVAYKPGTFEDLMKKLSAEEEALKAAGKWNPEKAAAPGKKKPARERKPPKRTGSVKGGIRVD